MDSIEKKIRKIFTLKDAVKLKREAMFDDSTKAIETHVPTHSKNSVALIPIARSSGSTPIVTCGSTSSGMADGKSVDASVATLRVVAIGERIGDPVRENPWTMAIVLATSANRNKGLVRIVDMVFLFARVTKVSGVDDINLIRNASIPFGFDERTKHTLIIEFSSLFD